MKKRIACMFMALMLVISLLPMGAVRASAASVLYASENAVNLIKQFEGFSASAFWDVSQWSIGYGTTGAAGQTITEAQADLDLREQLRLIDNKINEFTARNNLYLTQNRHDALVSFCFNCGTDWMTQGGRFFDAVVRNYGVNEFLFAISLWANIGTIPDSGLLNRRMAEANLYLNGVYAKEAPAAYTYVILDPNGGTPGNNGEDKMQGYLSGSNVNVLAANPSKAGTTFGGWFTSSTGGTGVKYLNASTAGRTLYAQYGVLTSVTSTYANVRNGAGTNYTQVGTVSGGSQIVIVETVQVGNTLWGRFSEGWVSLEYTNYAQAASGAASGTTAPVVPGSGTTPSTGTAAMGTVTTNVNVRSGAGTAYPIVSSCMRGQRIAVYETASVNGVVWGRIAAGQWVCLNYVTLDTPTNGVIWDIGGQTSGQTNGTASVGTVNTDRVNVRSAAGVGNPVVTILNRGTQVNVYSQVIKDNAPWGKIDQGWICMNYVTMGGASTPTVNPSGNTNGTLPAGVIATGRVSSTTALNVRNGAGTQYGRVNTLQPGTLVYIYERTIVNGVEWGRVAANEWVSMAYVTITSNGSGSTTPVTPSVTPSGTTNTTLTGTVTSTTALNVRSGAGTNYPKVAAINPGTRVYVYERVNVNGVMWGRVATNQWVCLNYVTLDNNGGNNSGTGTTVPTTGYTGRVVSSGNLNVRAAAGTASAVVGRLAPGSTVTIFELTNVSGMTWGRTTNGWVSMNYIQVISGNGSSSSSNVRWN